MQPKYPDPTPRDSVAPLFAQVMESLQLSNRGARRFLQNRVSLGMIKHMRAGRRNIPAWAAELLERELIARAEYCLTIERELLACASPGRRGNPQALRAWRIRRLAAKEKARE